MAPSNIDRLQVYHNQGMRLILGVPRAISANMMRYELHMLPEEHRAKLSRDKLYRKIRGNTKYPIHATINRRQRIGLTTEIQECHRLTSIAHWTLTSSGWGSILTVGKKLSLKI